MWFDYVLVMILAILAGGWSLPAGIQFGLDPLGVYIAAVVGSALYAILVLTVGGRWRDVVFDRFLPDAEEKVTEGRASEILERWGVAGLAVIGSVLLGPTITLAAALVLGVERRRFAVWFIVSTVVSFAVLTVFWSAVL